VRDQPASIKAQAEVFLVSELDKWIAHHPTWANAWHTEGPKDCHPRGLFVAPNCPLIVAGLPGGVTAATRFSNEGDGLRAPQPALKALVLSRRCRRPAIADPSPRQPAEVRALTCLSLKVESVLE
jgi:hypothetical protein